jgi:hypothetical protein
MIFLFKNKNLRAINNINLKGLPKKKHNHFYICNEESQS